MFGGSDGKESACNVGDLGSVPVLGRFSGKGNGHPLQYSWLGEVCGQRSLVGYSPRGHKELDMTKWRTLSFTVDKHRESSDHHIHDSRFLIVSWQDKVSSCPLSVHYRWEQAKCRHWYGLQESIKYSPTLPCGPPSKLYGPAGESRWWWSPRKYYRFETRRDLCSASGLVAPERR